MTGLPNCNISSPCGPIVILTPHFSLCCDDRDNSMHRDKGFGARSKDSKSGKSKRSSRKQKFLPKLKGGRNDDRTASSPLKTIAQRQVHNQGYDSDDCSLGSLGDRNEVKQDFFLLAPNDVLKKTPCSPDSRNNEHFFNTRSREQLNLGANDTASIRRRRRVFLKPRKAQEIDLAMPSLF